MEQQENKWYVLNVMAGQENKVATEIKSMITKTLLAIILRRLWFQQSQ
jgi:transcription antitermination factor NusG